MINWCFMTPTWQKQVESIFHGFALQLTNHSASENHIQHDFSHPLHTDKSVFVDLISVSTRSENISEVHADEVKCVSQIETCFYVDTFEFHQLHFYKNTTISQNSTELEGLPGVRPPTRQI